MRNGRRRLASMLAVALLLSAWSSTAGASGPTTLTVRVLGGATKTALRLQPGFATVLRADHRIDTVAIGDPRIVAATTVKRGQDVFDIVLQPQTATGVTNMVVWFGDLTSIWDLTIGPGQRTADIVYVLTAPVTTAHPASLSSPLPPLQPSAIPVRVEAPTETSSQEGGQPFLEVQQSSGNAVGTFQLARRPDGVGIRYRIMNKGAVGLSIRLSGILVRVNGRLVPFVMSQDPADKTHPTVVPAGAEETGVINATVRTPRQLEVIFSLFPLGNDPHSASTTLPITFQIVFAGLDRLPVSRAQ
jgi:hypothetical protein